jgi:hypothetical protein
MRTAILGLLVGIGLCSGCATTENTPPNKHSPSEQVAPKERISPVAVKKDARPCPVSPDPQPIDNPMIVLSVADRTVLPLTPTNTLYVTFNAGTNVLSGYRGLKLSLVAGLPNTGNSNDGARDMGVSVSFGTNEDVMVSGSTGSFTITSGTLGSFMFYSGFAGQVAAGAAAGEVKGQGTLKLALYELDYSYVPIREMGRQVSNCLLIPFKVNGR